MGKPKPIMRLIDTEITKASVILAKDELGGRRRKVYYRLREMRDGMDLDLGLPGYASTDWKLIWPTPVTEDLRREFNIENIGLIQTGDLEMHVNRTVIARETLERAEFYISDDSDALAPGVSVDSNYDLLGGQVLAGGAGLRARNRTYWVLYMRKRQTKARYE